MKTLGKCSARTLTKTTEKHSSDKHSDKHCKLFTTVSIEREKQWTSNTFSWPSLFVILCENTWKMHRSRAWENYRKTFRKTSCTLAFSWSRKTINKHHLFIAFTVDNSVGKRLENAAFARSGKL